MELSEKIDASADVSIRINIMFGPRLGCTQSICLTNWYDGCGLHEGPLGYDYEYTKDIHKYKTFYCRWLVELGRFTQEDVDCYNSLVSNSFLNLDCLLLNSRINSCLDLASL